MRIDITEEESRQIASAALKASNYWDSKADCEPDEFEAAGCRAIAKDYEALWLRFAELTSPALKAMR